MTTPTSPPIQPWTWTYYEMSDTWELTTPEYDPDISFKVTRQKENGRLLYSRYKRSTFPPELVDILKPVINQMDLFGQADKGNHEIRVNPGNVHQALTNLGRLHKILEQKRNGNRLQE